MCGIFGIISDKPVALADFTKLAHHAQQRGRDSSGVVAFRDNTYQVHRADFSIAKLLKAIRLSDANLIMGHSRLITNGLDDNQPVVRDGVIVLHNGIIVNENQIWDNSSEIRKLQIDTEVIAAITSEHLNSGDRLADLASNILNKCRGVIACALSIPALGKLCLFSNNGSLYTGKKDDAIHFASEAFGLNELRCSNVRQVYDVDIIDIPANEKIVIEDHKVKRTNLIPALTLTSVGEHLLVYPKPEMRRCTQCILPETMPYINFDEHGICNYCLNYKPRNQPKPKEELFQLVEPYRRSTGNDCIVPFSGGRDSCYVLHLIVNELKMRPVTYTYDWGMVTDLGRRNISRMCAELGVENIIVAADITKKRENITKNLRAWLKAPSLGMVSILTAGDKHFFRHVETIKKQTGISLNLWGVNPLEVTHFKAGFLGIPPDFDEERVYISNTRKQIRYQSLRFKAMLKSPSYFNTSILDTLSGEYYRSFFKKTDYFHVFDYWRWDERIINQCLAEYDWEMAPDTTTTWRIGDGTAAFYNYIYFTVAGFSEHDTFRSNQIREGQITRAEALALVREENKPRYPNIKWYLDAVGLDFAEVIKVVNTIPRLYNEWPERRVPSIDTESHGLYL